MVRLGDNFPEPQRREFVKSRLTPGRVVYLACAFTTPPKDKYLVMACVAPPLLLAVNSVISPYVQDRMHMLRCQVPLSGSSYAFLRRDCYIDCSQVIDCVEMDEITNQLVADTSRVKGSLTQMAMQQIANVVENAKGISGKHKKEIAQALGCQ